MIIDISMIFTYCKHDCIYIYIYTSISNYIYIYVHAYTCILGRFIYSFGSSSRLVNGVVYSQRLSMGQ